MNNFRFWLTPVVRLSTILAIVAISSSSFAQVTAAGFVSKPILISPISGVDDKEVAFLNVLMEPGASSPRHNHPGDCYGMVLEGMVELFADGQEGRRFEAGQAWHNPRGPVHYFKNIGNTQARLVNTLIFDKGKPRTEIEKKTEK